jgi:hypothetical protein
MLALFALIGLCWLAFAVLYYYAVQDNDQDARKMLAFGMGACAGVLILHSPLLTVALVVLGGIWMVGVNLRLRRGS